MDDKQKMIQAIKQEIEWCKSNPQNISQQFRAGFIEGLYQAMRLINAGKDEIGYPPNGTGNPPKL